MNYKNIFKNKPYYYKFKRFVINKIFASKNFKKYIIAFLALIIVFIYFINTDFFKKYWQMRKVKNSSLKDSTLCAINSDCFLYNCSNCGNKYWIDKNFKNDGECKVSPAGLIGCACIENVCKRVYRKQ
jgi:hypothetical protein